MTTPIGVGYLYDEAQHAAANARGENYWDAYLAEVCEQLGLCAEPVTPRDLADPAALGRYSALLLGTSAAERLAPLAHALERWVRAGGVLVGLGTVGLDPLFGVREQDAIAQPDGPFRQTATLALSHHPLTAGLGSPLQPDQRLLVFAPARVLQPVDAAELGRLSGLDGSARGAGVTLRRLGDGLAVCFAFGVAQTIWVLHKGQPVVGDRDGDGYLRVSDLIAIGANSQHVQYADELVWLLQNVLATTGQPFLSTLPPKDGGVPDLLCFWGGDDEAASNGLQRVASGFMREQGLPYHINAMARRGTFGLSPADAAAIRANGHEVSLHYNFRDDFAHPGAFRREDVLSQYAEFQRHFGFEPICTVNHCTHWTGWCEPAEWMAEAGGRADNSFIHQQSPPGNPVNETGFSFGTAFPHYFYRDFRGDNARLDFLEEPIVAYEVGYTREGTDLPRLHGILDHAVRYHLTLNMFYHPVYIAEWPTCRQAIQELRRYLDEKQVSTVHLGNDALWRWWDARHRSRIAAVTQEDGRLRCVVDSAATDGVVVKLPAMDGERLTVQLDGRPVATTDRHEFGRRWTHVVVPQGRHTLTATASV